jgi:two-component system sensor histidine kinase PhoQ
MSAAPAAGYSIRARLLLGAALVMIAFLAGAGIAVQRAHADSVRDAHFARLHGTVYLLLAGAELDGSGALRMPADFAEPRLGLPQSGLYAGISGPQGELWRSPSSVGAQPPLRQGGLDAGQWHDEVVRVGKRDYLGVSYAVRWATGRQAVPLVFSVAEDGAAFDREIATFSRTLWAWLGGAAVLLLVAQLLLLRWGLAPLRRVAAEIGRIESGAQQRIEGSYPTEISGLTDGLNALIQQERTRQERQKEALSFLAHSLKTPLAVLRNALQQPAQLPEAVEQQVTRMDEMVQHQLGRARSGGASRFAPPVAVAPVLARVRDALVKVHAEKDLEFSVACPPALKWRIDESDLFEIAGNLMDNAGKWARARVAASVERTREGLVLRVDDDGPGFADTGSVLQMHVRLDERVPGHGVGLAIVSDLVAAHQGRIALSRGPLGGARVEVVLPSP